MVSWKIKNQKVREFLAELIGTCTLVCLGCAGNAVANITDSGSTGLLIVPLSWGLALTVAIFVCGGVSGGHVNPAVTLGMASVGKLPWGKVVHYLAAQYIGGFIGAALTFAVYREGIMNTKKYNDTMGIFGTYSKPDISTGTALIDQIICTAFFLLIICAITDEQNMNVPKGLVPIAIGLFDIGLLHISFGYNCGTPLNPARDFSPRLLTAIAGWGGDTFSYKNFSYFWIPIVACHIGGILGCWAYRLFIGNHWPNDHLDLSNNNEMENRNPYTKGVRTINH